MLPVAAALLALATSSAVAAEPVVEIKPCITPLWLELSDDATGASFALSACGPGGVDSEGDEEFHVRFPNFELRQGEAGWAAAWSADPEHLDDPRNQTLLKADRQPVRLASIHDGSTGAAYQLRMWPRTAPRDLQINAHAGADQILRELVRVTGVRIDGLELQQPELTSVRFISLDRDKLIEFLVSSAWLLQVGPDHLQLGKARTEGAPEMSREDFLRAVSPQQAGDFPQPAIDVHADLALDARAKGRDGVAIEHLRAALELLQPFPAGEPLLRLRLGIELTELLDAIGEREAAMAALPAVDTKLHDPELALRSLALQLRWSDAAGVQAELDQMAWHLDALPTELARSRRLLLTSVCAAAQIAVGSLGAALPLQTEAIQGWRDLPYPEANEYEPGPQIRRQLLRNEMATIATLSEAGHTELVDTRIPVADWLERLGGDETPNVELKRLKEQLQQANPADSPTGTPDGGS